MFLGREIESGYDSEHWIDYPDEVLTPEPIGSLASQDVYARRRVLTLALKAKQSLTPAQLSQAVSDPDMYVRRTALRTIAKHKVQGASAAVLKALHDPENTVSCLAAIALAESSDAEGNADIARGGIRSTEHVPIQLPSRAASPEEIRGHRTGRCDAEETARPAIARSRVRRLAS